MSSKVAVAIQFLLLALVLYGQASASSPTCVVPPTGLVSWWTGDVDETDLYGVNDPSAVNVSLVSGEVLDGFTFGTDGYIDIPASSTLANQKFTWDAWVKPGGPSPGNDNLGIIIEQDIDSVSLSVGLGWSATDNRFRFWFGNVGSEYILSTDTFPTGTFYLVAGTYDGTTFRLYVNGVLEGSFAEKKTIAYSSSTWEIGSQDAYYRGTGYPDTWNGVIDEVEAFNVALPASKILSIFKAGSVGKCKAPVVVTPASEKFPTETVGTTSPAKTVMVLNNRNVTLTIDPFTFTGADPSDFGDLSTTCGSTLAARKTCKVSVTFTPQATGKRSAVLNVNDNSAGSPQTIPLSGTGK
jgi:concanavalin A-like lectin/glucanase superfamily protein/centrosomal CEP192-like protein